MPDSTPQTKHGLQMAGCEDREDRATKGGDLEETGPTAPWGDQGPVLPCLAVQGFLGCGEVGFLG